MLHARIDMMLMRLSENPTSDAIRSTIQGLRFIINMLSGVQNRHFYYIVITHRSDLNIFFRTSRGFAYIPYPYIYTDQLRHKVCTVSGIEGGFRQVENVDCLCTRNRCYYPLELRVIGLTTRLRLDVKLHITHRLPRVINLLPILPESKARDIKKVY